MHFHLPKPLHGWREFAGEIAIIVIGVLIALGAEQVVEWVHRNDLQREAQETIGAEIRQNLDSFRRRSEVQQCIDNRLQEIEALLIARQSSLALPRPLWVGRPQVWTVTDSRWNAATSGARLSKSLFFCMPLAISITSRGSRARRSSASECCSLQRRSAFSSSPNSAMQRSPGWR